MSVPEIKLTGDKYFQRNETFLKKKFYPYYFIHIYFYHCQEQTILRGHQN